MISSTSRTAIWPVRAAYSAALIFTLASGAINVTYGFKRGTDLASCITWATVAGAVACLFVLSWPALIRACERRQPSAAVMALCALVLSGSYSVTAALGSAAGGRVQAERTEKAADGAQERAQQAYNAAKGALAKLAPSRPLAEISALVEATRCARRVITTTARGRVTECTKPPALMAEEGRARERQRLQAIIDKASADLAKAPPPPANTDAHALARYLKAVGLDVGADRLNDLLTILAVLMIEAGGGLSLAVAMSLSGQGGHVPDTRTSTGADTLPDTRTDAPDTPPEPVILKGFERPPIPDTAHHPAPDTIDKNAAGVRFLAFLTERGGVLVSGQRQMGRALGWSKSWTHEVLHDLAGANLIKLTTGRTGTIAKLS